MKTIKIFVGSSIDELANERNELARFIQGLNNKYVPRGWYFEGYFCEESSFEMKTEGSQKVHNEYIENDADAAIFMFFTKARKFTLKELEIARNTFLKNKQPNVFVFFKSVDSVPAATEEIRKCVDKVANDYGHYFKMFDSVDTVKLELLQYLVENLNAGELKVEDGKVYIGAETVENINVENVFAYQNSKELKKLKEQKSALLEKMIKASTNGDDREALRISVELGETQKKYYELEKSILEMLKKFADENKKGEKADPRRMEALRLLELGEIEKAKELISQDEINMRTQSLETRKELSESQFEAEANEIVEDALIRIQALKQDVENINCFVEIEEAYESIYKSAQIAKRYDVIYDCAHFLWEQKQYPKAFKIAEKLKYIYEDPDAKIKDEEKAILFNFLGLNCRDNNDLYKAEKYFGEALEIYHRLAETVSKSAYEPDVAMTCNNLAALYRKIGRLDKAKNLYVEAFEIYSRLGETVSKSVYEPNVAATCNNFALLLSKNHNFSEAKKLYSEALEIYRRLAETVSKSAYEPIVATVCNNLANLYSDADKPHEAENYYFKALEIRRRLAETVSKSVYEPDVATTCNGIANLLCETDRPKEAENYYIEALKIRHRFAETVSKSAYEPYIATSYNNLANLYFKTARPNEAEKLYVKALEIYRRLSETVSKFAYEPNVATTCNNLADLYSYTDSLDEAEKLYDEALEIYRRLAETVSKPSYEPYVAITCFSLARLYKVYDGFDNAKKAKRLFKESLKISKRYKDTDTLCKKIYDMLTQ